LLHAVAGTIPSPDLSGWMVQSNEDLEGRTPQECIEAGDFDAVFRALWMQASPGPVS
jgi:hypothetical protein